MKALTGINPGTETSRIFEKFRKNVYFYFPGLHSSSSINFWFCTPEKMQLPYTVFKSKDMLNEKSQPEKFSALFIF